MKKANAAGVVHRLPTDLRKALISTPAAKAAWEDITPLARNEFICWVTSAKKPETREHRIERACDELNRGKAPTVLLARLSSSQTKGKKMVLTKGHANYIIEQENSKGFMPESYSLLSDQFIENGFTVVRGAFSADIAGRCFDVVKSALKAQAIDLDDPSTWSKPVVRINSPNGPAFVEAGASTKLVEIYDLLLGPGNWIRKKEGIGGTMPIRFPSNIDPGDAGWHIDGSYDVNGSWYVNIHSKVRGLLALHLFTDIGESDAPTEILCGSHLDIPPLLLPHGSKGVPWDSIKREVPEATFRRPIVRVTGKAGDVFVCHPFLIHRATWPHTGSRPRIIAQPEVPHREPFKLVEGQKCWPVEQAILKGLGGAT